MYKGVLHEMSQTTPTQYWLDSCSLDALKYAIERGAVGATTNPVIVQQVLEAELDNYRDQIEKYVAEMPEATEDDIAWKVIEYMATAGAKVLEPIFDTATGRGRISIQTNTKYHRSTKLLAEQAVHFNSLAPNMQVKIPAVKAGIEAIEEATYNGVSINATVSFSVPQALAVAEAVKKGLDRRTAEGKDNSEINPVCTIMTGRVDDLMKAVADRDGVVVNPDYLDMAGVAVFKNAYKLYQEKGYKTKLLGAAYRNHYHWSELIGGDVLHTIPYKWQVRFNNSDVTCENRMDNPVDPKMIEIMREKFADFRRVYDADGMKVEEFDNLKATQDTLKGFYAGYDKLVCLIRTFIVTGEMK